MIPLFDSNPSRSRPVVTKTLIYLNVFVFLLQLWLESRGVRWLSAAYGLVPSRLSVDPSGEWFKALTSLFLHGGWGHLGWNMLFLYIFGDNVEDRLGKERFLFFYLLAGVAASVAQYSIDPSSPVPVVGASGAIAGVLGGYLVLYPRAPVTVLNPIPLLWLVMGPFFALPAWFVVGEWFVGNLIGGIMSVKQSGGGIAFFAHLGGFIAGLLVIRPLELTRPARARVPGDFRTRVSEHPAAERRVFWKNDDKPFWK